MGVVPFCFRWLNTFVSEGAKKKKLNRVSQPRMLLLLGIQIVFLWYPDSTHVRWIGRWIKFSLLYLGQWECVCLWRQARIHSIIPREGIIIFRSAMMCCRHQTVYLIMEIDMNSSAQTQGDVLSLRTKGSNLCSREKFRRNVAFAFKFSHLPSSNLFKSKERIWEPWKELWLQWLQQSSSGMSMIWSGPLFCKLYSYGVGHCSTCLLPVCLSRHVVWRVASG